MTEGMYVCVCVGEKGGGENADRQTDIEEEKDTRPRLFSLKVQEGYMY